MYTELSGTAGSARWCIPGKCARLGTALSGPFVVLSLAPLSSSQWSPSQRACSYGNTMNPYYENMHDFLLIHRIRYTHLP